MPKSFEKCGQDVHEIIRNVIADHHADLESFEVTVQAVFITATDGDGQPEPAIKKNGMQVWADIRKTSTEQRARGMADALMRIDKRVWDDLDSDFRIALIDHELTHLQVTDGEEKCDDLGRPRLQMRPHDWEVTGFAEVIKRHGRAAPEFKVAKQFKDDHGQLLMWAEDAAAIG